MSAQALSIRVLEPDDAPAWKQLRIEMLTLSPEGFHADLDRALALGDEQWVSKIPKLPDVLFGLFDGEKLVGSAGFYAEKLPKLAHRGVLWGVYVAQAYRGAGRARELVRRVIEHARDHVDVLCTGSSAAGARVYRSVGFIPYGIERDASRVNGKSYDSELLSIHFRG